MRSAMFQGVYLVLCLAYGLTQNNTPSIGTSQCIVELLSFKICGEFQGEVDVAIRPTCDAKTSSRCGRRYPDGHSML